MTWKSSAAAGGMVVATWLASHAPVGGPREPASVTAPGRTETTAAEIQQQADRLHARLREVGAYHQPARNPFRFKTRMPAPAPHHRPEAIQPIAPAAEPDADPFRMVLSGIGEEGSGDQIVRTAIISTPDDVHLLNVGDTIGGYTVTAIAGDAVELVHATDGSARRLTLRP